MDSVFPGRSRRLRWTALAVAVLSAAMVLGACSASDETPTAAPGTPTERPTSSPTATASPAPSATEPATATATPTEPAGPAAPTDVVLTGVLPDTDATVEPGEGETGRVTVEWNYDGEPDGFRIYLRDCDGNITRDPLDIEPGDRMYGPLQPCRPGGEVGVAAYDARGESEIVWAVAGEAT